MASSPIDYDPKIDDTDNSTIFTANTPPDTILGDFPDHNKSSGCPSVPWPGSTFVIRSISSGQVITLNKGEVELGPESERALGSSIHWACEEKRNWLGFMNVASGCFLGHQGNRMFCNVKIHNEWENFCVRHTPEGGYILLVTRDKKLWKVGTEVVDGVEKLVRIEGEDEGTIWEFLKPKPKP